MAGGGGVVRWLPRWLNFFQGLPKISQGVRRSWAAGTQCWAVSTALCWGGGGAFCAALLKLPAGRADSVGIGNF